METTSVFGAILRRWWIIVLLAVVGAVVGALPEPQRVETLASSFRATHTMLLNDTDTGYASAAVSPSQVSLLATTGEVPSRVAEQIDFSGNPALLASQVTVAFDFATGALTFTTQQPEAERAELVVDTFADVTNGYLAERQDIVYQERIARGIERLSTLEAQLNELTFQLAQDSDDPALAAQRDAVSRQYSVAFEQSQILSESPPLLAFTTLERAQAIEVVDRGLSAPTSRPVRAAMGGIAGLALGIAVAVLLARVDRRIRTREQAEAVLDMRARVTVPKTRDSRRDKLVVASGRHDALSDSYRTVRNVVGFVQQGLEPVERARVTLVVSPGPGDGKTSLATNLAAAFVETGQRTIVVNTDFRRPRLARAVDEHPAAPHPFTLEDLEVVAPKSLLTRTETSGLLMLDLSTIDGTAGELVRATAGMMPAIAEVSDAIVVDTSPVGATAEVLEMVPFADVVVVTVRLGHTSVEAAKRTVAVLRDLTTAPILLVVNSVKQERAPYYEYTDRRSTPVEDRSGWRGRLRPGKKSARDLEKVG